MEAAADREGGRSLWAEPPGLREEVLWALVVLAWAGGVGAAAAAAGVWGALPAEEEGGAVVAGTSLAQVCVCRGGTSYVG